jgi:uncharacterized membrane protein YdbT with pleckstrin-like domain
MKFLPLRLHRVHAGEQLREGAMEEQLDRFRPSTLGWLRGTLTGWATIVLALAGIGATIIGISDFGAVPLIVTGLALLIVAAKWIGNLAVAYEVTPERLIVHRGIFMKSIDEVELYRVKDCRIDFSLINQWADIGTITITSSDETTRGGALVLHDIQRARARREELRRLVDTARQKRRVREIDMVQEDI